MNGTTQFDEYMQMLEAEYLRNIAAGLTPSRAKRAAKKYVNEAYPEIYAEFNSPLAERAGQESGSYLIEMRRFWQRVAPNDKTNSSVPSERPYSPMEDIEKYLRHLNPAVGDEILLNLDYLKCMSGQATDSSWRYPFIGKNSRLLRDGWQFTVLNSSGRKYRVRIEAVPPPPRSAEEIERENQMTSLEAQLAKIAAEIARLKRGGK